MVIDRFEKIVLSFLIAICICFSLVTIIKTPFIQSTHYLELAKSFLQLKLDLTTPLKETAYYDTAYFNGKYYIYFGIVPGLLFMPIVAIFGDTTSQRILSVVFLILDFYFLSKIIRKYTINPATVLWLSIYFIFGTIFISMGLLNITSYQVQLISVSFLIIALYEFYYQKRWFLIGLMIGLAGATRPTLYLSSIYFILHILFNSKTNIIKTFLLFSIPIFLSLLIVGIYNFARFNNPLEAGYNYQFIQNPKMLNAQSAGPFSLKHVPGNLYSLFYRGFEEVKSSPNPDDILLKIPFLKANPLGLSIILTSPIFLFALLTKVNKNILFCWINILILLIPILTFYSLGFMEYGYRYALDFYPFLFLILAAFFRNEIPLTIKGLIIYCIIFNFIYALSIWGINFL